MLGQTRQRRGHLPHALDRTVVGEAREPGVLIAEGLRLAPVRLRAGHRSYLTSVIGLPFSPHGAASRPIEVPPGGVTLTRRLSERIQVQPGDILTIEVLPK